MVRYPVHPRTYIHRRWSTALARPRLFRSFFSSRCYTGTVERKRRKKRKTNRVEERTRSGRKGGGGERKERKAESWLDAKPVERHALGIEKQTKRGMGSRRLENHRCDSSQVPIGRPSDRPTDPPTDRPTAIRIATPLHHSRLGQASSLPVAFSLPNTSALAASRVFP